MHRWLKFTKRHARVAGGAFVIAALLTWITYVRWAGPVYQGKRVRFWVQELGDNAFARDRILEIPEKSTPYVLAEMLACKEEQSKVVNFLQRHLPYRIANYLPTDRTLQRKWTLLELLGQLPADRRSIPACRELALNSKSPIDQFAISLLARFPEEAKAELPKLLNHPDIEKQSLGYQLASYLGASAADHVPLFVERFKTVPKKAMWSLALALASAGNEGAAAVKQLLQSAPSEEQLSCLLHALRIVRRQDAAVVQLVIPHTSNHDSIELRTRAFETLGQVGTNDAAAIETLRIATEDALPEIRAVALGALSSCAISDEERYRICARMLASETLHDGEAVFKELSRSQFSYSPTQREAATQSGLIRVLQQVGRGERRGRLPALAHLARLAPNDPATHKLLLDACADKEREVRVVAMDALRHVNLSPAAKIEIALKTFTTADDAHHAAALLLASLGDEGKPALPQLRRLLIERPNLSYDLQLAIAGIEKPSPQDPKPSQPIRLLLQY